MDQNRVENQVDEGTLQIHLTNASTGIPVKGAKISISYTGGPQQVLEEVDTDDSGNTEKITLDAPPLEYSMVSIRHLCIFFMPTLLLVPCFPSCVFHTAAG